MEQTPAIIIHDEHGQEVVMYGAWPKQLQYHESTCPNLLGLGTRGTGKAVALGTPIPTPQGYRVMSDLTVGGRVFDESGKPTRIVWKSEPHIDHTGTYRLTFDDGEQIVCGGQHEWFTLSKVEATRTVPEGSVKTTQEVYDTVKVCHGRETNHRIPLGQGWHLPKRELPIDPYILGVWLGDGHKDNSNFTSADIEVVNNIKQLGYEVRKLKAPYVYTIPGLITLLRALDAEEVKKIKRGICASCQQDRHIAARYLCKRCYETPSIRAKHVTMHKGFKRYRNGLLSNKRIPFEYLWASKEQRLSLLQGLLDTDGCCDKRQGSVEFCNTNKDLADGVYHLAVSLGLKPTIAEGRATLYGKDCGPKYRVCWTATLPVFRLERKLQLLPVKCRPTQSYRYIVAVERIADQLVQCIEVENPSHLYLVGHSAIPTHNSLMLRADAHMRCLLIPNFRALIIRRTMPELRKSHLNDIDYEMHLLGGEFLKTVSVAHYPNGSTLTFAHCYDEETEVLTKRGFLHFRDLTDTDQLASLNQTTGQLQYDTPRARQKRRFIGRAIHIKSRGIDLLVTPDHPVLCWDNKGRPVVFDAATAAARPRGRHPLRFRRTAEWVGVECGQHNQRDMDDWLYFLGWFLSEGHTSKGKIQGHWDAFSVSVAQKKDPTVIDQIAALWERWGYRFSITDRPDGVRVIRGASGLYPELAGFGKSHEKHVPDYVKGLSPRQIKIFLDALFAGDGTVLNGKWIAYTTTSKRLADDVQELLLKIGMVGTVTFRNTTPAYKKPVWAVIITHTRVNPYFDPKYVHEEPYDGYMYDVTMPNSPTLLVRRNGHIVWGHNCETEADVMNFLSSQYGFIGFDELSTFTLEQFLKISAAARAPVGSGYTAVVRTTSNTLGIGSEWMKAWFVDKDVRLEDYPDYNPDDFQMIFSTLDDNPSIDANEYRKRLKNLPDHIKRAWLLGEFIVDGAYFTDFRRCDDNGDPWHVIDDVPTLKGVPLFNHSWLSVYRAIDWGYSPDPAVCLWIAVLPNKRVIVFKERTWRRTLAADVATQIKKESEDYHIVETFADPTMFIKTGTIAFSIAELFEQNGVPLTPSLNDRELYGYAIQDHLSTLIDGSPKLQIVKPEPGKRYGCHELLRTIPQMRTDSKNTKKMADGNDHWVIALAYFCMGLAMPSRDPIQSIVPRWMMPKSRRYDN